ncbi:hypothetical protein [Streptomyces sp. NPDC097610]|uniref:hypothetical protein n=1 Tax=Streptomyces sp. NPDC097610 TaxID=3157227 RepID=UPI00331FB2D7
MRNTLIATLAVASVFVLAGCGGSDDKPKAENTPSASVAESSPDAIPSPDAAQTQTLISALRAVDSGLVVKKDRAVSRARSTCQTIKTSGYTNAQVHNMAKLRFEGGNVPSLTDEQTAKIVDAVKTSFCK